VQAFGFPKTEARVDTNLPGTVHIAAATPGFVRQYFQAAVIEHHPLDLQDPVKLRLLGDDLRDQRYPGGAWRNFSAFNAATAVTAGQTFAPQIVDYTPSPTPAAATPTASPAPTASPTPASTLDPLSVTGELIVVGTTDGGVLLYDGAGWRQLDKDRSVLSTNRVQAVLVDKDGRIWAGTDAGLFRLNRNGGGAVFDRASTRNGIGSDNVTSLAGRQVGDVLWMTHPRQGASRFDGQTWERVRSDNTHLPSSDVREVRAVTGTEGGLSFATANGATLYDEDANTWFFYNTDTSGIASNDITAVEAGPVGALWFGTSNAGVSRTLNPLAWDHFDTGEGLASNNVRDVLVASDGTVWVATAGGVSWFRNNEFSTANVVNAGLPSNSARALAEDSQGHIWVATDGGVGRFDGSTWTAFTAVQGLPTNNASSIAVGVVVSS
jgi:ligand-binding sensor domain-containing protein